MPASIPTPSRTCAPPAPPPHAALDAYLADHGWRVVSQYSPRALALVELPDVLVRAIRAASTGGAATPPDSGALRARVPATDRRRFDELLADARATYFLRDDNVALTFMWPAGLVRRALLEAGRRLHERGALDERGHVMALGEAEIAAALAGDPTLRAVAADRAARGLAAEADGAPVMLGDDEGPPPDPKVFPAAMAELVAAVLVPLELEEFGVGAPPLTPSGPARASAPASAPPATPGAPASPPTPRRPSTGSGTATSSSPPTPPRPTKRSCRSPAPSSPRAAGS